MENTEKAETEKKSFLKKHFKTIFTVFCIALVVFFRYIPAPSSLPQAAMGVIGTFIGCVLLWTFVGIDWPSVLCLLSLGFISEIGFATVIKNSFGTDVFVFLLFTFMCTWALSQTNFIKNVTIWFMTNKVSRKGPWHFVVLFTICVMLIGMVTSPTVLFVALLPIVKEIFRIADIKKGEKLGTMFMLLLGFTISISSGMTPIGHVFPVIALGLHQTITGVGIGYLQYMLVAIPVGVAVIALMLLAFKLFLRPEMDKLKQINYDELKMQKVKTNKKDIIVVCVFALVIIGWILPSIFQFWLPETYAEINAFGLSMPPLIGVLILSVIKTEGKPVLSIGEAAKNVPWTSLIICAGALAVGAAIASDAIGIKGALISFFSTLNNIPVYVLLIILVLWALIQTNFSSNIVTSTVVTTAALPLLMSVAPGFTAVAAVFIGMLSAFAFATPPAMPYIAIINDSGYSTAKQTFAWGGIVMIISLIVIMSLGFGLGVLFL